MPYAGLSAFAAFGPYSDVWDQPNENELVKQKMEESHSTILGPDMMENFQTSAPRNVRVSKGNRNVGRITARKFADSDYTHYRGLVRYIPYFHTLLIVAKFSRATMRILSYHFSMIS